MAFKCRLVSILIFVVILQIVKSITLDEFEKNRSAILREEASLTVGGNLVLTSNESIANSIIMEAKYKEIDDAFNRKATFNPGKHFFIRKAEIEESTVFKFIKQMPKGAALHVHDTSLIGGEYLIKNITYRDNLYVCQTPDNQITFRFSVLSKLPRINNCTWILLQDMRNDFENVEVFDATLAKLFTLEVSDPVNEYSDINDVWMKFGLIFKRVTALLTYKPVWEDYFYEALKQYRDDNVLYIELRTTLPALYDLTGRVYNSVECATIYKKVNDRFKTNHPDSFGARIIYAPARMTREKNVRVYIEILHELKKTLGDFVAGFDLVGQEDLGKPLKEFMPELLSIPSDINVFYHAGETNWFGTQTDSNLVDAVLLNAKRIGHGYGILKHPGVCRIVKEKSIAIEVNPLSNQILMLVDDLRNHPASIMLAENYPVVISSDDPGLWGALPLSHDMYAAFVGLASRHSDIRLLKQLAINSINYSSMGEAEKISALLKFNEQWSEFIYGIANQPIVILQ